MVCKNSSCLALYDDHNVRDTDVALFKLLVPHIRFIKGMGGRENFIFIKKWFYLMTDINFACIFRVCVSLVAVFRSIACHHYSSSIPLQRLVK